MRVTAPLRTTTQPANQAWPRLSVRITAPLQTTCKSGVAKVVSEDYSSPSNHHTTCKTGMAKAVSEDYRSPSNKHNLRICYREECQLPPFQSGPSRAMDVGYLPPNPTPRKLLFLDSGGGFLLACEDFGRMLDSLLLACALSICFLVEIRSSTLIPLFRPGSVHSG